MRDVLLYFTYPPVENVKLLSPIQLMKGLFLIKQELKLKDFYEFEPYHYSPCSFDVYRDLEILTKERLITQVPFEERLKTDAHHVSTAHDFLGAYLKS
jgi:Fe2+ or Zn2+ uptake regulation protein